MNHSFFGYILVLLLFNSALSNLRKEYDYAEMIRENGYEFEEHEVETEDGYILSLWRIPNPIGKVYQKAKPVVLQHGLFDDSWTWFTLKKGFSIPYILSDKGYDIWVPNSRGNIFSYLHKDPRKSALNPFSDYWSFSFAEMADYDVPAVIKYIKNVTKAEKLDYIGHSQGTTTFFLQYTINPEFLSQNIDKFVALGPVPSVSYATSKLVKYLASSDLFKNLYPFGNLLRFGVTIGKVIHALCDVANPICAQIVKEFIGNTDTKRIDFEKIKDLFYYEPGGSSHHNVLHWLQCYNNKRMERFDYGKEENLKRYGTEYPPVYDLEKIKKWDIPFMYTFTDTDPFSSVEDVNNFVNLIQNKKIIHKLALNNYNHLDYIWSSDSKEDISEKIVEFLQVEKRTKYFLK